MPKENIRELRDLGAEALDRLIAAFHSNLGQPDWLLQQQRSGSSVFPLMIANIKRQSLRRPLGSEIIHV